MQSSSSFSGDPNFRYHGHDLDAMELAKRYYRQVTAMFRPFLGKNIVEVGGGTGTIASHILTIAQPDQYILIEPDAPSLDRARLRLKPFGNRVRFYEGFSKNLWQELPNTPDTIVYVNVLEHVENDLGELRAAVQKLAPGGHIIAFSPAGKILYSPFDKTLGHYRRYTMRQKDELFRHAGLDKVFATYFDILGFFGWFVQFKVFRARGLNPRSVKLYETFVAPLMSVIEPVPGFPFGKNVLYVGRKT